MNSAQSSILVELNISGRDRVPASEARRRRAVLPVDRRPSAVRPGPIRSRGSARYPQFVKFGPTTSRGPQGVRRILSYINDLAGTALPRDVEWGTGFRGLFYRDLWHLQGRKGKPHSPKRTFDLCLFSEDAIVILEAKAQQAFEAKQLERFKSDCKEVKAITGVGKVWLLGWHPVATSLHPPSLKHSGVRCLHGVISPKSTVMTRFSSVQINCMTQKI